MLIVNKHNPCFSLFFVLVVAILTLFLVSCETDLPQETPLATISSNNLEHEAVAAEQESDVVVQTAVFTPQPTKTPIPTPPTPLPTGTPSPQLYTVQEGETLAIIADRFGTTTDNLQRANEITDGHAIYVGQELIIPAETAVFERGVLHNQILCPASDEIAAIDLEGGTIIGETAVCRLPIVSHQFGEGDITLVLVGGIHGGYEWNTIMLAYAFIDYLELNPEIIPPALSIMVIPNANPDGLFAVTRRTGRFTSGDVDENSIPGRFNGNDVDLNRNWDCEWASTAAWRDESVSGGSEPFSERESQHLRDFMLGADPAAVVLFHSAATGVYASGCGAIDSASADLVAVYGQASGYPQHAGFQQYAITGDASNWLAMQAIPAITVELTTHEFIDWRMNFSGLNAVMNHIVAQTSVD